MGSRILCANVFQGVASFWGLQTALMKVHKATLGATLSVTWVSTDDSLLLCSRQGQSLEDQG